MAPCITTALWQRLLGLLAFNTWEVLSSALHSCLLQPVFPILCSLQLPSHCCTSCLCCLSGWSHCTPMSPHLFFILPAQDLIITIKSRTENTSPEGWRGKWMGKSTVLQARGAEFEFLDPDGSQVWLHMPVTPEPGARNRWIPRASWPASQWHSDRCTWFFTLACACTCTCTFTCTQYTQKTHRVLW